MSACAPERLFAMFRNWVGNQHIHTINPHVAGLSPQALAQVHTAQTHGGIFHAGGPVLVRDTGGPIPPGLSQIWNGTGHDEWVNPNGGETKNYFDVRIVGVAR